MKKCCLHPLIGGRAMLTPEDMTRVIHHLKQSDIEPAVELLSPQEYERRKREEFIAYIKRIPQVCAWLEELERQPGDIAYMNMERDVTRDYEREEAEHSHWKIWKPVKQIT